MSSTSSSTTPLTHNNSNNPTTLRWGIVGCGDVCEVKSGPAFYKSTNSKLVAVMRRDIRKAESFAKRHHVSKYYNTVHDLVQDPEVDCVYVATPPGGDRISISKEIVKAKKDENNKNKNNKKYCCCYMEKPLGRDAQEAQQIVQIFQEAQIPLYVAYYRRYMPKFLKVQDVLNKKQLGRLTGVRVTLHWSHHLDDEDKSHWHYDRNISGGGLLLDVGCHALDLVDFLIGPIMECTGSAFQTVKADRQEGHDKEEEEENKMKIEDAVQGMWHHNLVEDNTTTTTTTTNNNNNGAYYYTIPGSCSFNFSCGGEQKDEILIMGTMGSISFSCFDPSPPRMILLHQTNDDDDDDDDESIHNNNNDEFTTEHPEHVQQPLIQKITNEILSVDHDDEEHDQQQEPCSCTGETGLRTQIVMDKLLNNRQRYTDEYI